VDLKKAQEAAPSCGADTYIYRGDFGRSMQQDDIWQCKRPAIAVDVVLLAIIHDDVKVALIQRQDDPYFGKCALPGRFVRYEEPIDETARKALETKGNIDTGKVYLEQLYTFGGNLMRDTRIRTISTVYYGLVNPTVITSQKDNKFLWESVYKLPPLAFDHKDIIESTVKRIRAKIFHTDLIFNLMPREFTLSQLQRACEIILDEKLDKRNFRKKMMEIYVLKDLKRTHMEGAHRPAALYSFVKMRE
jgi:8-oxo-dGTP diphosphatase